MYAILDIWTGRLPALGLRLAPALAVLVFVLVPGCKQAVAPPPLALPQVTVSRPIRREVVRWDQFTGYLSSPETVTVKARVSGVIVAAPFKEGAMVHAGDLLFKIDPRPFQADLDSKRAAVAQARAAADKARADFNRYSLLIQSRVIARADYDSAKAMYEEAAASLNAAAAALETSRLNLEWTDVRAPITGRVSRMNVTVGNLVSGDSTQATALTTLVSIDPLYCYINVPESTALRYQRIAVQQHQANVTAAKVPCFLQLESESNFPHRGVINFVDNQVDASTGTVQMRCAFANPTALLVPGLFAVTRIPASDRYRALLIPDVAINTDQNEQYLLIVGADNVVERRPVKLGALFGDLRSVTGACNRTSA